MEQFQNSTLTLGATIQRVMEKRNHAWDPTEKWLIMINNTHTNGGSKNS